MMTQVLQFTAIGLVQASFLILASLGFALTRRVEGFLNIAHAQLLAVSAFTTLALNNLAGWHFVPAALMGIVASVLVALISARLVYDPMRTTGPSVLLITSVGLLLVLEGLVEGAVGTGTFLLKLPRIAPLRIGGIILPAYHAAIVVVAVIVTLLTVAILQRTRIGMAIRVTAADRELAASRGVNTARASTASWIIAAGLAGVAGVALAVLGAISAGKAVEQILIILAVALLAGLGSIWSVVASALVIGLAMELSLLVLPAGYRPIIAFGLVIVTLVFLPNGLSGDQT